MKHTLKGIFTTKKVYLNGKLLDPIEITKEFGYVIQSFDWGKDNKFTTNLAIAIMLKLNKKSNGYIQLKNELLINLNQKEDFDIEFELINNARKEAMRSAHTNDKDLTHEFLMARSDAELCCFIHPLYREEYKIKLGLRTVRTRS
jgi:hypothetical protein